MSDNRSYTQERLIEALWQCYAEAGSDTDGMTAMDAYRAMDDFPRRCVEAVEELRRDYHECLDEAASLIVAMGHSAARGAGRCRGV